MKKIIFTLIITFLFINNVAAQDIEQQLTNIKNNIISLKEDVKTLNKNRLNKTYPIGSIYITTIYSNTEEVSNSIGGKWEVYNTGKTLVGVDENDTDFNEVNKTSGTSTTILSSSNLPEHAHEIPALSGTTSTAGIHRHTLEWGGQGPISITYNSGNVRTMNLPNFSYGQASKESTVEFKTTENGKHTHDVTISESETETTGEGTSFTNLQPYITVYMYKRVG